MPVISNKPFIECIPNTEMKDRLDIHFYKPELRKNTKEIENLSDLISIDDLILNESPIASGATPKGANYLDAGIPFLRVQNVRPMTVSFDDIVYISSDTHKELNRSTILLDDILLTITGATFGYSAVFKSNEFAEANVNQHIVRIRIDINKAIPSYIALFLNSQLGYWQSLRYSTGGSRPALDFGAIKQFLIPCPEKTKQIFILERFALIKNYNSELFAKAQSICKKRDELFDSITDSIAGEIGLSKFPRPWFGRLYFQKAESEVDRIDVLGANPQFEDECWASGKFVPLSEVCEVEGSNEQIPLGIQRYISIDSLPGNYWGDIDLPEMEIESQTGRTHFYPGDIAWAHLKPSILQGKAYIIHDECWGSHHFLKLNTSKVSEDLRTIIWAYLKTGPIKRHLANKCTGKSESQKDVSDKALGMLPFPKLDDDQIKRVASSIRDTIERSHELEAQENAYKEKADDILKKAKSNIFNLLDDDWFNKLVSEAKEALQ